MQNGEKMGEDFKDIDYIVLSHGHLDHSWGLKDLITRFNDWDFEKTKYKRPTLVAHPLVFNYKEYKGKCFGSIIDKKIAEKYFDLKLTKEPLWLTENLVFLGEIERTNSFENIDSMGEIYIDTRMRDDYLLDDSALVYKGENGNFIITGCSHSGICNIIDYAKKVTEEDKVQDVIGGIHMISPKEEVLESTVGFFEDNNIKKAHLCHCIDLKSKIKFSEVLEIEEVGSGLKIEI
jgi:7,8-dihydropterin-6-yl-methyl-4-(beta-D-ribofuranosyl)aminobenzene 5'-phosphate synthase